MLPVQILAEGGPGHRLPVVAHWLMVDLLEEPVQIQLGAEAVVDVGGAHYVGLVLRGNLRQIQAGEEAAHVGHLTGDGIRHLLGHQRSDCLLVLGDLAQLDLAHALGGARYQVIVAADVIVMPRSCSCSIQSIVAAPSWTSPIL